eukprot:m.483934 g.483934  ORF g.483934 m.483934 type:complete len:606 (-) comp23122_c0_seq1:39-1856(-)
MRRGARLALVVAVVAVAGLGCSALPLGGGSTTSPTTAPAAGAVARAQAAILGSFVCDAAAMPLHWIYSVEKIQELVNKRASRDPAFYTPVSSPYYTYPEGAQTPFGEQMFTILRSLASTAGVADVTNLTKSYYDYFMLENATRSWHTYVDNCTRGFVHNVQTGKEWPETGDGDDEVNAEVHTLVVAAAAAVVPDMTLEVYLGVVDTAIRIWQNIDAAVVRGLTFARILWHVIRFDTPIDTAIERAAAALRLPSRNFKTSWDPLFAHALDKMRQWQPRPPFNVTREIGQGCDFPYHTFTANHFLLHNLAASSLTYTGAVRQTILIGGENGARGMMTAGVVAAKAGDLSVIPAAWKNQTTLYNTLAAMTSQVVKGASGSTASQWPAPVVRQATTPKTLPATKSDVAPLTNSAGCVGNANVSSGNLRLGGNHSADHLGLRALYLASGGPKWTRNACWLNDTVPICQWDQVLCNDAGRVAELRLSMNNLVGTIPDEVGLLSELAFVQLVLNPQLVGPVPAAMVNTSIAEFYAWETGLTALPDNVGSWSTLRSLDVSDCKLQSLPASLTSLNPNTVNTAYLDGNPVKCPVASNIAAWVRGIQYHDPICSL